MPIAQVTAEYTEEQAKAMEELKAENEELKAKVRAMEDEKEEQAKAMEEEEDAKASATGVQPVARIAGSSAKLTATQKWNAAVSQCIEAGQPKHKAVQIANRQNPGLREEYLKEVNSK